MAVTVDLVKKLILEHIGGVKVVGNAKNVIAAGQRVVVQKTGLPTVSDLVGEFGNLDGVVGNLVSNPIAGLTTDLTGLSDNLLTQVTDIGLPGGLQTSIQNSLADFDTAVSSLKDHTDILSGLVTDPELIPSTKAALSELSTITDADTIDNLAGAIFKDDTLIEIKENIDPSRPGGITGLLQQLQQTDPSDTAALTQITERFNKTITDYTNTITQIVTDDEEAYASYKNEQQVGHAIQSMIPSVQTGLFDKIASSTLKDIANSSNL